MSWNYGSICAFYSEKYSNFTEPFLSLCVQPSRIDLSGTQFQSSVHPSPFKVFCLWPENYPSPDCNASLAIKPLSHKSMSDATGGVHSLKFALCESLMPP